MQTINFDSTEERHIPNGTVRRSRKATRLEMITPNRYRDVDLHPSRACNCANRLGTGHGRRAGILSTRRRELERKSECDCGDGNLTAERVVLECTRRKCRGGLKHGVDRTTGFKTDSKRTFIDHSSNVCDKVQIKKCYVFPICHTVD